MGGWRAETEMVFYDAYANKTRWNTYMLADRDTTTFDYGVAAELFMARRKGGAEAIRFAIEELPAVRALGAWMQVGDERFDGDDIQRLYESDDYPLQRRLSD